MIDQNWQPRPSDIAWTQNMIDGLRDGGIWGIPANRSVWKLDKQRKVFVCIHGPKNDDMFHKITVCCRACGYATEHAPESLKPQQVDQHLYGTGKATTRIPSAEKLDNDTGLNLNVDFEKAFRRICGPPQNPSDNL
jgi:hypothetical protein